MTRFSRRRDDGVVEYHASEESLQDAARREAERSHRFFGALLGTIGGGLFAYLSIKHSIAVDWPKWARFVYVVTIAGLAAAVISRLATLLLIVLSLLITGTFVAVIVGLVWKAL